MWMSTFELYLKRDSNIGVFQWFLWIIQEHLFCRISTNGWFWTADQWSLQPKINLFGGNNGKLGEGIHKTVQSDVVIEIRWEFHCHTCTDLGIENKRKRRTEKLAKVA